MPPLYKGVAGVATPDAAKAAAAQAATATAATGKINATRSAFPSLEHPSRGDGSCFPAF